MGCRMTLLIRHTCSTASMNSTKFILAVLIWLKSSRYSFNTPLICGEKQNGNRKQKIHIAYNALAFKLIFKQCVMKKLLLSSFDLLEASKKMV